MTVLACGPYIGDFEQELFSFRPYVRWISKVSQVDSIYLSTHFNRTFLYDWIEEDRIIPVFHDLSRNELSQHGTIHDNLQIKDYTLLTKIFKEEIIRQTGTGKRDISLITLPYTKSSSCPLYNKLFRPVPIPDVETEQKFDIIFIPDIKEDKKKTHEIYDLLKSKYNVGVIGDFKTHLCDENLILKRVDYFENGYKYIVKYISEAKAVICPAGHWTLLCNMQKAPVFSWGESISHYTQTGIYGLGNRNSLIVPRDNDIPARTIYDLARYFIERQFELYRSAILKQERG
jgi:hypothetical protein